MILVDALAAVNSLVGIVMDLSANRDERRRLERQTLQPYHDPHLKAYLAAIDKRYEELMVLYRQQSLVLKRFEKDQEVIHKLLSDPRILEYQSTEELRIRAQLVISFQLSLDRIRSGMLEILDQFLQAMLRGPDKLSNSDPERRKYLGPYS